MDFENEPEDFQSESDYEQQYNKSLEEIDSRLDNPSYSQSAKNYLLQNKNFIRLQHDSSATYFAKNYTLQHDIKNFDTIVNKYTPYIVSNERESILEPTNMNQIIEAYAILVDLKKKLLNKLTDLQIQNIFLMVEVKHHKVIQIH